MSRFTNLILISVFVWLLSATAPPTDISRVDDTIMELETRDKRPNGSDCIVCMIGQLLQDTCRTLNKPAAYEKCNPGVCSVIQYKSLMKKVKYYWDGAQQYTDLKALGPYKDVKNEAWIVWDETDNY